MTPEPTGGKRDRGERVFYFVLWLVVAAFIVGPIALWLSGYGSTVGAFMSTPLALLVGLRLTRRAKPDENDLPSGSGGSKPA